MMTRTNQNQIDECPVKIDVGKVTLEGDMCIPPNAQGLVIFAHGSGSGRHSPRNQRVARIVRQVGLATLLFDLLTLDEEAVDVQTGRFRFDIRLLANRLIGATEWVKQNGETRHMSIGYFGASTGAAASLLAAAEHSSSVSAVVSRGGRPDLARAALPYVKAPTLLIVGGRDLPVIAMNRDAFNELRAEKKLIVIPGATHLFEEQGALDEVAKLASGWLNNYLTRKVVQGASSAA